MGGSHKWKRGMAELPEARFTKSRKAFTAPHFTMLARGFQSVGMGETTDGESGIGELPQKPFVW